MLSNNRRSPTLVNVCDFNTLYARERNASLNTKTYLSSKSVISPISARNLRLVVTNGIPSNILILPRTLSPSQKSFLQREKKESKKPQKSTGFDVYRSLARPASQSLSHPDRDAIFEDMTALANSITVDRISPLSNTGLFRTNNLPKISKQQINSNGKSRSAQLLETISKRVESLQSTPTETPHRTTPAEMFHRTTPDNQYHKEEESKLTTSVKVLSYMPNDQTRKQLHVYMPAISC